MSRRQMTQLSAADSLVLGTIAVSAFSRYFNQRPGVWTEEQNRQGRLYHRTDYIGGEPGGLLDDVTVILPSASLEPVIVSLRDPREAPFELNTRLCAPSGTFVSVNAPKEFVVLEIVVVATVTVTPESAC